MIIISITIIPLELYGDSLDWFACITNDMSYKRRPRGHCHCLWLLLYFMNLYYVVQRSVATQRLFIDKKKKNLLNQMTGDMRSKIIQLSNTYSGML